MSEPIIPLDVKIAEIITNYVGTEVVQDYGSSWVTLTDVHDATTEIVSELRRRRLMMEKLTHDRFPNQNEAYFRQRVNVVLNYDTNHQFRATVLRYDVEAPFQTIFQLDDGRVVLSTECQWQPVPSV